MVGALSIAGCVIATEAGLQAAADDFVCTPVLGTPPHRWAFDTPEFELGDGWGTCWGTNWDGRDELGDPNSGSALLHHDVQTRGFIGQRCISGIEGNGRYSYSAAIFIPAAQQATGSGNLQIHWFSDSGCLQHMSFHPGLHSVTEVATWEVVNGTYIAPPAARSAQVTIVAVNDLAVEGAPPPPAFDVLFDNIYFGKWDTSPRFELNYRTVPMLGAGP